MSDLVETAQPETQVSGGQDTSFESVVNEITEAPSSAPSEAPKQTLDDQLSAVFDKMNGKAQAAPPAPTNDQPKAAEVKPVSSPAIDYPTSWSSDYKDKWGTLPPEVQKYVSQREQEASQLISRQGSQLKAYEPLRDVYGALNQWGVPQGREAEVIQSWARAQQYLDQNPAEGLKWLAQSYGVDLGKLVGQPQQQGQPQNPIDDLFKDPRVDEMQKRFEAAEQQRQALEQQLRQVTGHLSAREQAEMQKQTQFIQDQISKFAANAPHFSKLEDEVTKEINFLKTKSEWQGASAQDLLKEAYDRAAYANKEVRELILADQRKAETEKAQKEAAAKQAQAKKISSMNVRTGVNASTPTFDGRWDDADKLSAVYDRIQAGR